MVSANGSGGLVTLFDGEWGPWVLTVGAGVASALFFSLRQRLRGPNAGAPSLPGNLARVGAIQLREGDVGDEIEVMRDFSRAIAAGGVHMMHLPDAPSVVKPPQWVQSPANVGNEAGIAACKAAFVEALAAGRTGPIPEAAVRRLVAMLSVGPAVSLLLQVGCPPSLQSHRFVVVCGDRTVRVLTIGFLPNPQTGKPQQLLTIASPNLLLDVSEGTELSYSVRPVASDSKIETEVAREMPRWMDAYTDM
jgi:hypothetical protein